MQRWIRHFESSSAQSVEKVEEIAGALDASIRLAPEPDSVG